jgi:hypothetical protein
LQGARHRREGERVPKLMMAPHTLHTQHKSVCPLVTQQQPPYLSASACCPCPSASQYATRTLAAPAAGRSGIVAVILARFDHRHRLID